MADTTSKKLHLAVLKPNLDALPEEEKTNAVSNLEPFDPYRNRFAWNWYGNAFRVEPIQKPAGDEQ